jgi:hypothetical protein
MLWRQLSARRDEAEMPERLPEDVQRFIVEHVNSVEQLETLLLLRSDPHKLWTVDEVSHALYTQPAAAQMRLGDLQGRGLLAARDDNRWQYATTGAVDELVGRMADLYRDRRVTVITLIYSKPQQQVQAFADAFKLRKDQ